MFNNFPEPCAVVLGNAATGLSVVRELGRAGIPVVGVSRHKQNGGASKYLRHYAVCPTSEEMIEFLTVEFVNRPKSILIPTSDQEVEFVSTHASKLSQHFRFQNSYATGLAQALVTKASLYEICAEHGVTVPRWLLVTRDTIDTIIDQLEFPVFVKPSQIHKIKRLMRGQKGWIVRDKTELKAVQAQIPDAKASLIVQEIVPGPDSNILLYCAYFDAHSEPHQVFTGRKLRQYPPGFGSASLVVSETLEQPKEITERLMTAIGYQGIAASEFKIDPRSGQLKLIEINPRPSLWFGVTPAAGKHVSLAAYHDLSDAGTALPEMPQTNGVGWRYYFRDIYSAYFYRTTTDFILPAPDISPSWAPSKTVDAVSCKDDPEPARLERRMTVGTAMGRLFGRVRGSLTSA